MTLESVRPLKPHLSALLPGVRIPVPVVLSSMSGKGMLPNEANTARRRDNRTTLAKETNNKKRRSRSVAQAGPSSVRPKHN